MKWPLFTCHKMLGITPDIAKHSICAIVWRTILLSCHTAVMLFIRIFCCWKTLKYIAHKVINTLIYIFPSINTWASFLWLKRMVVGKTVSISTIVSIEIGSKVNTSKVNSEHHLSAESFQLECSWIYWAAYLMVIFSIGCWSVSNEIKWTQRNHWKCTTKEKCSTEFHKECGKCSVSNYVICTTSPSFKLFSLLRSCNFAQTHTFVTFIAQSQLIYELNKKKTGPMLEMLWVAPKKRN